MWYTRTRVCGCVCSGLVPEPTFQREADEAAERTGRPEARVFPEPEANEGAGWPVGAWGAHPQRTLLLLWRYGCLIFSFFFDTLNFNLVLTDNVLAKHWIVKNLFCIIRYFLLAGHFFLMFCLICHYPIPGELFRSMPLFKDDQWVESTLGLSTFNRLRCFHTILNVKWVHNVKK